jgi:hypothetical protein
VWPAAPEKVATGAVLVPVHSCGWPSEIWLTTQGGVEVTTGDIVVGLEEVMTGVEVVWGGGVEEVEVEVTGGGLVKVIGTILRSALQ